MTAAAPPADLADLGRIFAEPAAYAEPVAWHAAARRLREEAPISKVSLPDSPDFWAITKHAHVMEIERNPEIFTNEPVPALATKADVARNAGGTAQMKSLVHSPLQVILSILGLPEDDHARMLTLTQELFGAEDPDIGRAGEDHSVLEVMLDFVTYFTALANDRKANPTGDLASVIANAELDGTPLPDMDVFGFSLIIATAGHDTTSNSSSSSCSPGPS